MTKKELGKKFPEHVTWPVTVEGITRPPVTDPFGEYNIVPNNPFEPAVVPAYPFGQTEQEEEEP